MIRRGLSIRYKILLLLTLVPLITLSAYLMLAVRVFENDKVAYVFESGLAVAKTLSAQSTTELGGILTSAKPVIQEFLSQREFGKVSAALFDSDSHFEWVAVFERTQDGQVKRIGLSEKVEGVGARDVQSFGDLRPLINEAEKVGRIIRVPFKDNRVLIVEKVGQSQVDAKYFLILGKLDALATSFQTPGTTEVYLVNEQGFVLFGPTGSQATYLSERMPIDFISSSKEKNLSSGTEQILNSAGKSLLASFSSTNFGQLMVVSIVDKAEAFRAVDILIRRSLVFFVLLLAGSTIVSLIASGSLTSALTDLFSATKRVADGHFDIQVKVRSSDEIGSLADSFNAMASEVSRLLGETADKARMESELKTAQTVQETLFPPANAEFSGFKISGYYEPASECGGDWWHYCQVDNKIFLWIGDATGHGAPAALITSAAKSASTIIERLNVEPAHAMELLNRAIYDVSKGKIMMTFFLASFDLTTKELIYSNASHEAPYLIKTSDQPLKKKNLEPLNEVNNPRLGQARDTKYEQVKVQLDLGDRILFYTDGIPDIENPEKTPWGEREFIKSIIETNKNFPPIEMAVGNLVEMFSSYRKGAPLKDDITFFMAHFQSDKGGI